MKILLAFLFFSFNAFAMERWTALAMMESGSDDSKIGKVGEVSRYQIRPELWAGGNPLDAGIAYTNAWRIMASRIQTFEKKHNRSPNDFEFYVLWNAPDQINHPHGVVMERARRFVNLVRSPDN